MSSLRFRQIHLDFHTSGRIPGVGAAFDPKDFARTLKEAAVDSITCFSRCHHGYIYHDTRFGELRHPTLERDLLSEQIEACRAVGVNVPIYITVGFDMLQTKRNPGLIEQRPDGSLWGGSSLSPSYELICFSNQDYVAFVCEQTREVMERFNGGDGIFFDIMIQGECVCPRCLQAMEAAGLDALVSGDRLQYARSVLRKTKEQLFAAVRDARPDCPVFFNAGHIGPEFRSEIHLYSHLEVESLPSGGWGYDHFPRTVRYARTLDREVMGMTGRFLRSWGDFGGMKHPAALELECFSALAEGARCSIGDQLHPSGAIDKATYGLIGGVYRQVAAKEPWCQDATPCTEIAVFNPEALGQGGRDGGEAAAGALHMLQEGHHQFDFVDGEVNWDAYKVLIFPDNIPFDEAMRAKAEAFHRQGGALVFSHRSGMAPEGNGGFVLDGFPVRYKDEAAWTTDYFVPRDAAARGIPATPLAMYEGALQVEAQPDADVLADLWKPYFNRSWRDFCSHTHTPPEGPSGLPAAAERDRIAYFAHPIFSLYGQFGAHGCRQLFLNVLERLLGKPMVETNAPATARVTMLEQPGRKRYVVHLLHYIPGKRCSGLYTVESALPLIDVRLSLALPEPQRVYAAPEGLELDWSMRDGRLLVSLPQAVGHAMVVVEHGKG